MKKPNKLENTINLLKDGINITSELDNVEDISVALSQINSLELNVKQIVSEIISDINFNDLDKKYIAKNIGEYNQFRGLNECVTNFLDADKNTFRELVLNLIDSCND